MHTEHFALWINPNHQTMVITWDQQQVERDLEGTGERYPENGHASFHSRHTGEELTTILSGFLVLSSLLNPPAHGSI